MPTCFKNQCDHEVRMILAFLPHAISLFLVIWFELLITRTFFWKVRVIDGQLYSPIC